MADYTKREASKAEVARFAESWSPKERKPPRCHCDAPAVFEVNTFTAVTFYCTAHLPADPPGGAQAMTMEEEMHAGSVGDIGRLGDGWSFTLYDNAERELLAFVFADEPDERKAAKAMQDILASATAVSVANEKACVRVPILRADALKP